jgi:asparagine synthase (glutamine-hydrolysing)
VCGIAGAFDVRGGVDAAPVDAQLRCLSHRGPDSSGVYARCHTVIGQTRLAVIDLVTGDPPISSEDGHVGVALNGEIYNYQSIRADLVRDGHEFATAGDTEVIAHLGERREPAALAATLDGMFAFALWDDRRRRLVLGRDRVGKKPLYYWMGGGRLVFASEIKALLAHPWVPRELDADVIPAYLTFGYVPTPRTFFAGIRSVPPGHVLIIDEHGHDTLECYWEPHVAGTDGVTVLDFPMSEAAAEVRRLLERAVCRRLVADVPLGAFLSGGVDSSGVVGVMAQVSERPVLTFTIGFEDNEGFDERPYALAVAQRFGTDHVEFVVRPDAVDLVERLVWHNDQAFGDSSAVPTYLLSELTRKHVTVALCGDGGDELFAGYERFAAALALHRYQALPRGVRRTFQRAFALVPAGARRNRLASIRRFLDRAELSVPEAYLAWISYIGRERRDALMPRGSSAWALDDYWSMWDATEGAHLLDRLLELNLRTYLLDDLLPKVDRMAMAHALEVRSPFLDRELIEFAFRLPPSARVRGMSLKRVLKHAVRDLLPDDILRRRKHGFGVPLDRWFRSDLGDYVDGTLGSPTARLRRHLEGDAIDALIAEHRAGRANHGDALWTLLTLEVFLRQEGW